VISQSSAIIEYLEETHPEPALLPKAAKDRAQVRRMVALIACDIQPLNNLKVLKHLKDPMGHSKDEVDAWYCHWITLNFRALEALVADLGNGFCFGDKITMADVFLLPQIWNARRFDCDLAEFKNLLAIEGRLGGIKAFRDALPENQPDAE